mgnify:FL=1|tara:strand:- start:2955 stop:3335 length:381 start_codon:yes stop_codon:yes gene_type:complete
MKITKTQLKQIIKEELERVLEQDAQGYKVQQGMYGSVSFLDPEGNEVLFRDSDGDMEPLDSGSLMQLTEKLPGFFDIVNKEFLARHRQTSGFGYPDPDAMVDYGGFMPGKGYKDLLNLYVNQVLKK